MSLTKNDLQNIGELIDEKLDEKLDPIKKDITRIDTNVISMKETLDDLVQATGAIFEWTDDIHRAFVGKSPKKLQGN